MTDMEAEWVAAGSVGESDPEPGRSEESDDALAVKMADLVAQIASKAELFHDPDGVLYGTITVDGHHETWPLKSRTFKTWVLQLHMYL